MRTRSAKSAITTTGRGGTKGGASADAFGRLGRERRARNWLRAARGSSRDPKRVAGPMIDERAVERARALLGCAAHGIRPPGDW